MSARDTHCTSRSPETKRASARPGAEARTQAGAESRAAAPLVHVVVLTHNGKHDTLECLASMRKIEYPSYRLVLVDNASTDDTAQVVERAFPGVTVVHNAKNLGYAGGNNVGIELAIREGAAFVLLANNDITVAPDMLTHLVQACRADEAIAMAGPTVLYYDEPDKVAHRGCFISRTTARGEVPRDRGLRRGGDPGEPVAVDYVGGCAILIRTSVVQRIGALDERFFAYYEETDWCFRAREAGYRVVCVPRAEIWHKVSRSWNRYPLLRMYYEYRNRLLFLWKRASYPRAMADVLLAPAYGTRAALAAWRRGARLGPWPLPVAMLATLHFVLGRFGKAPYWLDRRWAG